MQLAITVNVMTKKDPVQDKCLRSVTSYSVL